VGQKRLGSGTRQTIRRLRLVQRQRRRLRPADAGHQLGVRFAQLQTLSSAPRLPVQRGLVPVGDDRSGGGGQPTDHYGHLGQFHESRVVSLRVQVSRSSIVQEPAQVSDRHLSGRHRSQGPGPGPEALPQDQHLPSVGRAAILGQVALRHARRPAPQAAQSGRQRAPAPHATFVRISRAASPIAAPSDGQFTGLTHSHCLRFGSL